MPQRRIVAFGQAFERHWRRTGATLPGGDPRPTHHAEMEGWFWRFTDVERGRVVVALCGINRHEQGDWATVALVTHPEGGVTDAVVDDTEASDSTMSVRAGSVLRADGDRVVVGFGDRGRLDVIIEDPVAWPLRLGGGGLFSALPWLGQYWHPHVLGGVARGTVEVDGTTWRLDGAEVYAEKNWGHGFPERWWWGQAQGFSRRDLCVAFGGGVLTAGPASLAVGGVVVRVGAQVLRFTPPFARVHAEVLDDRWVITAHRRGQRVRIVGEGVIEPYVLPVPIPAEHRNVHTDLEHLAGRMTIELRGRIDLDDVSLLAGLETGHRPS